MGKMMSFHGVFFLIKMTKNSLFTTQTNLLLGAQSSPKERNNRVGFSSSHPEGCALTYKYSDDSEKEYPKVIHMKNWILKK